MTDSPLILLGHISTAQGIRGEVVVKSHTEDPADIAAYGPLSDITGTMFYELTVVRVAKKGLIARVKGAPRCTGRQGDGQDCRQQSGYSLTFHHGTRSLQHGFFPLPVKSTTLRIKGLILAESRIFCIRLRWAAGPRRSRSAGRFDRSGRCPHDMWMVIPGPAMPVHGCRPPLRLAGCMTF